jgi:hypothetical protein
MSQIYTRKTIYENKNKKSPFFTKQQTNLGKKKKKKKNHWSIHSN